MPLSSGTVLPPCRRGFRACFPAPLIERHGFGSGCPPTFALECVSKRKIRKFEWILRQFKEETRRLSSAKSRVDDAEMAQKTPKLRIRELLRHALGRSRRRKAFCLTRLNIWLSIDPLPPILRSGGFFSPHTPLPCAPRGDIIVAGRFCRFCGVWEVSAWL